MAIHSFRHRVTLKRPKRVPDARRVEWETTYPPEDWAEVWAAFQPLTIREQAYFGQIFPNANAKVILRYDSDIGNDWVVAMDGQDYDIVSIVDPDYAHRTLQLLVTERTE